jgi:hypothetical protein
MVQWNSILYDLFILFAFLTSDFRLPTSDFGHISFNKSINITFLRNYVIYLVNSILIILNAPG